MGYDRDYRRERPENQKRLYIGNISRSTKERDVRDEFERFGKLSDLLYKESYAFVEFRDSQDAQDAIRKLHGREIDGRKWTVEETRKPPKRFRHDDRNDRRSRRSRSRRSRSRGRDRRGGHSRRSRSRSRSRDRRREYRRDRSRSRDRRRGGNSRRDRSRSRARGNRGTLSRGQYRIHILNVSKRTSWQDLKDWAREKAGPSVVYGDISTVGGRTFGVVEFTEEKDMEEAVKTCHRLELAGRVLYVYKKGEEPSTTPSYSPKRSRSGSESPMKSKSRSVSDSRSRSRSRSKKRNVKEEATEGNENSSQMEEDEGDKSGPEDGGKSREEEDSVKSGAEDGEKSDGEKSAGEERKKSEGEGGQKSEGEEAEKMEEDKSAGGDNSASEQDED